MPIFTIVIQLQTRWKKVQLFKTCIWIMIHERGICLHTFWMCLQKVGSSKDLYICLKTCMMTPWQMMLGKQTCVDKARPVESHAVDVGMFCREEPWTDVVGKENIFTLSHSVWQVFQQRSQCAAHLVQISKVVTCMGFIWTFAPQ